MVGSVESFLPIIVIGPISDLVGTTLIIVVVAIGIFVMGIASIVLRPPLSSEELAREVGEPVVTPAPIHQLAVVTAHELLHEEAHAPATGEPGTAAAPDDKPADAAPRD